MREEAWRGFRSLDTKKTLWINIQEKIITWHPLITSRKAIELWAWAQEDTMHDGVGSLIIRFSTPTPTILSKEKA